MDGLTFLTDERLHRERSTCDFRRIESTWSKMQGRAERQTDSTVSEDRMREPS